MGYTMIPLKKNAYSIDGNIFTWPMALNLTGAGYLLGYGENTISPGQYFYKPRNGSPVSNDGFKVTATEAKTIAKIFRGYISTKKSIREEFEKLSDLQKEWIRKDRPHDVPPGEEFLDKIEKIAAFCEQSGGFRIR